MDKRITFIVDQFDYIRVHKAMHALGWKWAYSKTENGIPSIGELVNHSIRLMEAVLKHEGKENKPYHIGSGGFYATLDEDLLTLTFELTSSNCDKDLMCY
jgi:hypothetical protein